jgi:hypothetical protein
MIYVRPEYIPIQIRLNAVELHAKSSRHDSCLSHVWLERAVRVSVRAGVFAGGLGVAELQGGNESPPAYYVCMVPAANSPHVAS